LPYPGERRLPAFEKDFNGFIEIVGSIERDWSCFSFQTVQGQIGKPEHGFAVKPHDSTVKFDQGIGLLDGPSHQGREKQAGHHESGDAELIPDINFR
jgi:hypothetical protein